MFKPSDSILAGVTLLAALSASAFAAVTPLANDSEKSKAGYQLRCWQEGRLLFEEHQVTIPQASGAPQAPRVVAIDRSGRPIYLIDSPSATCQLRHVEERPEQRPLQ